MTVVTADLISRARAGDGDAFRELTEPHRRELQVHCYRMLGSFQDAEDALQDTLLAAWQGFGGFEGRASLRTWLYRIATNRCLNARRSASRRPAKEWDVPSVRTARADPARRGRLARAISRRPARGCDRRAARPGGPLRADRIDLAGLRDRPSGPAASPARRPHLARRPRIPRERGGRHAGLDRRIGQQRPQTGARQPAAPTVAGRRPRTASRLRLTLRGCDRGEVRQRVRVRRSRRAGGPADRRRLHVDAADAASNTRAETSWPASAPASSARAGGSTSCRREPTVSRRSEPTCAPLPASATGPACIVLTLTGDRICAMTRFENSVLPWFGLPRSLPN